MQFVVVAVNMHNQRDILVVVVAVVVLTCISFKRVLSHLVVVAAAGFHFHFDLFFFGASPRAIFIALIRRCCCCCSWQVFILLLLAAAAATRRQRKNSSLEFFNTFLYAIFCGLLPKICVPSAPFSLPFVLLCLFACCFVFIRSKRCSGNNNNSDSDSSAILQCHLNTLTLRQWV